MGFDNSFYCNEYETNAINEYQKIDHNLDELTFEQKQNKLIHPIKTIDTLRLFVSKI